MVVPLVGGDQGIRCRLGAAAVHREPVGDHLEEQLFHHGEQAHLLTVVRLC